MALWAQGVEVFEQGVWLNRPLQPLQRLGNFFLAAGGLGAFFLFLVDDFLRRIGDEFFVVELGVDASDTT